MTLNIKIIFLIQVIPLCTFTKIVNLPGKKCYGNICLESDYDADIWPEREEAQQPIVVDMKYEIDNIISVDSDLNLVGIQLSLHQTWMDNRVSAKNESLVENGAFISAPRTLYKEPDTLPKVWLPSIWIFSMTDFEVKGTFTDQSFLFLTKAKRSWKNTAERLQRHSSNAESGYFLVYYTQFDIYIKCNMKYERFPFDRHLCYVNITSADLNANILRFTTTPQPTWHHNKTELNKTRYFDVIILPLEEYENETMYENTPWSITGFKLGLSRRRAEYVYNYILTSALCVVASWASFVIPPEDANARVAIFITMILVLVTIFSTVMEKTPVASEGTTAIIIWMLSMFMFVFVAFLGYCVTLIMEKRKEVIKGKQRQKTIKNTKVRPQFSINPLDNVVNEGETLVEQLKHRYLDKTETTGRKYFRKHKSDLITLSILFVSFSVYTCAYGMIYTFSNPYSNA